MSAPHAIGSTVASETAGRAPWAPHAVRAPLTTPRAGGSSVKGRAKST